MVAPLIALIALALSLAWALYLHAGVYPSDWVTTVLFIGCICLGYWFVARRRQMAPPVVGWVKVAIWALPCYCAFQLLPLPLGLLHVFSPVRAQLVSALAPVLPAAVNSAPIAVDPPMALYWGFTLLSYIAVFFLVRELAWRFVDTPWVTVVPLLAIGFIECVFGMIQVWAGWPNAQATGTFTNRDHFSGMLEMLLPLAVMFGWAILQRQRENFDQNLTPALQVGSAWAVAALFLVAIVYSLSRMGFFVAICSLFVTAALSFGPRMPSKNFRTVTLTALALGALALFIFLPPDQLLARFAEMSASGKITADTRLYLWKETFSLIDEFAVEGILYATRQLALFGDLMKQDRTFAEMSSGFAQSDDGSTDPATDELQQFACHDLFETARKLLVVQKSYKSEFPTLGILPSVSLKLRQLYEMDYRVTSPGAAAVDVGDVSAVRTRQNVMDQVHDDYDKLEKDISEIYDLMSPRQKDESSLDLSNGYCRTLPAGVVRFPVVEVTPDENDTRSVYLGYLAALAAFAEFVDGNRESAIQLLDDRISKEISAIDALSKAGAYPSAATDRFAIAQKEALVLRLIRWEANLIKFAASPQDALDTFAAKHRYRDYVDVVTRALRFLDRDGGIARRIVDPRASCPVDALGALTPLHDKITIDMQRKIYFTLLYYKFTYHNNLISVAGANRQVAVDDGRVDLKLVADLDQWADELPNVDLSCLKDVAGVKVDDTARSFFWESIGSYRESKGRNFFLADSRGPAGESCRAITAYRQAKSAYEETPVDDGSTELEAGLSHQDDANYRQRLDDRICAIKGWMKQVYAEGDLDREPACAEALAADVCPGAP